MQGQAISMIQYTEASAFRDSWSPPTQKKMRLQAAAKLLSLFKMVSIGLRAQKLNSNIFSFSPKSLQKLSIYCDIINSSISLEFCIS